MKDEIKIDRGQVLTLTAATGAAGAAWWFKSGSELVRAGNIAVGTPLVLGPYTTDATIQVIMDVGGYTHSFGESEQVPTSLATHLAVPAMTQGDSVDDCSSAPTVITQLNALLATLRANGIIAPVPSP